MVLWTLLVLWCYSSTKFCCAVSSYSSISLAVYVLNHRTLSNSHQYRATCSICTWVIFSNFIKRKVLCLLLFFIHRTLSMQNKDFACYKKFGFPLYIHTHTLSFMAHCSQLSSLYLLVLISKYPNMECSNLHRQIMSMKKSFFDQVLPSVPFVHAKFFILISNNSLYPTCIISCGYFVEKVCFLA